MILDLDLGNTRGKWCMLDGERCHARGTGIVAEWLAGVLPPEWRDLHRIRAASVLAAEVGAELAALLRTRLGPDIEFASAAASCAGVRNAYAEPARLGVDRWLGMVAAYHELRRALVVVSAGTALTVDVVATAGEHRGGYIIPGARLMAEALLRSTDRVRFAAAAPLASVAPGNGTDDCVHHGIALALAGAVRLALAHTRAECGAVALVLAGGDATALAGLLADEMPRVRPDIVLDGLRLALP